MRRTMKQTETPSTDTVDSKSTSKSTSNSKKSSFVKDLFTTQESGWAGMKSTTLFRTVNFELYAKPNKFVMAVGGAAFLSCISYIFYMNWTDDKQRKTYVTLDEDGGTTTRPKVSRWF